MTESSEHDAGIIFAMVARLRDFRIPRALSISDKMEQGEILNDYDLAFLDEAIHEARENTALVGRHPEYLELAGRLTNLYTSIMDRAVENEKNSKT